jgi:hypothetical protein
MDIISTISEIGILETLREVSGNPANCRQVVQYLPPVDTDYVESRISSLAASLINTGKSTLFMMLPELALLECLAEVKWKGMVILALPFDMEEVCKERIRGNIPDGINTVFQNEGTYPSNFISENGVIVCTGIAPNSYRQYLLPSCCRMMSMYKVFRGGRLLLSCFPPQTPVPEIGWTYTEADFFTRITEGETI